MSQPGPEIEDGEQRQAGAYADHGLEGEPHDVDRGTFVGGHGLQTFDGCVRSVKCE